jgi:spore germination protein GerM
VAKQRSYGRSSRGKYSRQPKKKKKPTALVFWAAFLVLITGLFFINRDRITESLESTQLLDRLFAQNPGTPETGDGEAPLADPEPPPLSPGTGASPERRPAAGPEAPALVQSPPRPLEQRGAPAGGNPAPAQERPPERPAAPPRRSGETAEQFLYFIQVDDEGAILRNKVSRRLPVSGTPLLDTLRALVAGPSEEESRRGLISLIPPDTQVLSAAIEGNTARINFSEEFQYNTAGMEGLAAQLTQIIWTATEFPQVRDVQILIEGNRIDHLGEGVPVWSPLNRQSF